MIFDREDIAVLNRVMVRKGIETAAVSHNPGLTDAQRMMMTGELARDISRCQMMIAVGMNDFSDTERQLESSRRRCPRCPRPSTRHTWEPCPPRTATTRGSTSGCWR